MTTFIIEIKDWFMYLITGLIAANTVLGLVKYFLERKGQRLKKELKEQIAMSEKEKPRIVEHEKVVGEDEHPPLIWIQSENAYFPLGVELTSLENGELILATPTTPRELIVGVVSMCGLETK